MTEKPVAIVTGASRGIGAAAAREFGRRGYCVTLAAQTPEPLNALTDELGAAGIDALPLAGDLAQLSFAETVVEATAKRWGRIDVLVNNAAWRELGTMRTIDPNSWDKTIRICLTAPAFMARWAADHMERRRAGVIVNVSSIMSQQAAGISPAYIACKGGMDALTYELASLYGPSGIRVVAVNPGAVDTAMSRDMSPAESDAEQSVREFSENMIMLRRWAAPEEMARTIAWVASDEASYLTGTTINVDGGWHRQHLPYSLKRGQFPDQFP